MSADSYPSSIWDGTGLGYDSTVDLFIDVGSNWGDALEELTSDVTTLTQELADAKLAYQTTYDSYHADVQANPDDVDNDANTDMENIIVGPLLTVVENLEETLRKTEEAKTKVYGLLEDLLTEMNDREYDTDSVPWMGAMAAASE